MSKKNISIVVEQNTAAPAQNSACANMPEDEKGEVLKKSSVIIILCKDVSKR